MTITDRTLFLYTDIDAEQVAKITEAILAINNYDNLQEQKLVNYQRTPIYLFINSNGGVVYDGLALVDIMTNSKTPIITIAIGKCMSMALIVFLSGHERYVSKNATFMFHSVAGGATGKLTYIQQELGEARRLNKICCDIITKKTKIKEKTLIDFVDKQSEWYFDAQTAIKYEVANALYKGNMI